jgi:predicted lipoprotein with Yx(FWY)xxD motif
MKKNSLSIKRVILPAIVLVSMYGCTKTNDSPDIKSTGPLVKLNVSPTLGQYLEDQKGVTLYFFSDDYKGLNTCAGTCEAYWPYFYAGDLSQDKIDAGLNLADFDTIHVGSKIQTTYKGWPLYYFSPAGNNVPEDPGQITGESIANWYLAKPDYTIMLANGQMVGGDGKDYLDTYLEGVGKTVYFTDDRGLALYIFTPDSSNINKYTHPDFSNDAYWPIYQVTQAVVPSSLDKTLFSDINVFGKHQLTYKGWPLYYFGGDSKTRGNTKGITVPTPGSKWPIAEEGLSVAPHK